MKLEDINKVFPPSNNGILIMNTNLYEIAKKHLHFSPKGIQFFRKYKKVYRNELCPCGSGLKYKHCCYSKFNHEYIKNEI